jgi:hypothetical protein
MSMGQRIITYPLRVNYPIQQTARSRYLRSSGARYRGAQSAEYQRASPSRAGPRFRPLQ